MTLQTNEKNLISIEKRKLDILEQRSQWFLELMSVMHKDGGHYHTVHGDKKSYEKAVKNWYNRKEKA